MESIRDKLNKQIAEKDSFINKTLIDTSYLDAVSIINTKLKSTTKNDKEKMEEIFESILVISKRLTDRINKVNKENGYKALL